MAFSTFLIFLGALAFLVISTPSPPPSQPIEFSHKAHLDYFQDGRHRRSMISMHEEMMKKDQLWEQDTMKQLEEGGCIGCHRDFDQNAPDLAKLSRCGECHRAFLDRDWQSRKDQKPCMGCHNAAGESPQASVLNTNTCAACHLPPLGADREETKLADCIKQGKTIPWARVYDYLPGEIIFSHERHVELGRVRCQECHGAVERAERPLSLEVKLSMEDCMSCHEATGANNDCLACHK